MSSLPRPAVFFDRDGVLNRDSGYLFEPERLVWTEGARQAVKAVNEAGYWAFVVTNQSGVARGYYEERDVEALHRWMDARLAEIGAHIDAYEYCPFHPEAKVLRYRQDSARRKPAPGMILDLLRRYPVDAPASFLIGDKQSDLDAGRAAGIESHLFCGGDLAAFVHPLLNTSGATSPRTPKIR